MWRRCWCWLPDASSDKPTYIIRQIVHLRCICCVRHMFLFQGCGSPEDATTKNQKNKTSVWWWCILFLSLFENLITPFHTHLGFRVSFFNHGILGHLRIFQRVCPKTFFRRWHCLELNAGASPRTPPREKSTSWLLLVTPLYPNQLRLCALKKAGFSIQRNNIYTTTTSTLACVQVTRFKLNPFV